MHHSTSQIGRNPRQRTFDRGGLFVKACPMNVDRAHTHAAVEAVSAVAAAEQQPEVGALSLIPSCLGITGHPSGSQQGHPRYTGARSAGRPWVARTQFSTAVQCRNTANIFLFSFFFFLSVSSFLLPPSSFLLLHVSLTHSTARARTRERQESRQRGP